MKNLYCVIMGGGIGSRFWPFSRECLPKQFLDFLGMGRSLLQLTFHRFAQIMPAENIYIVTNQQYVPLIKEQLPELTEQQILAEPARRNTAPCLAYAAWHIRAVNPNANVVVAPSDHLILQEERFLSDVRKGLAFVSEHAALLTLGIPPSRPETAYGYIQSDATCEGDFCKVKTFTEKPNKELAEAFFQSGEFFWNSGLFLSGIQTLINAFAKHLPDVAQRFDKGIELFNTPNENAFIQQQFPYCPNISIDYGIMEKADNVWMMPGHFGWADLGTWNALYDIIDKDPQGNAQCLHAQTLLYECSGNIIALDNPNDSLIVLQGLRDCIVAQSRNVLLICKRNDEERIKQFIADAQLNFSKKFT